METEGLKVLEDFRDYIYTTKMPFLGHVQIDKPTAKFCPNCGNAFVWKKETEAFDVDTGDFRVFEQLRCKTQVKYKVWRIFAKKRDCIRAPMFRVYTVVKSK